MEHEWETIPEFPLYEINRSGDVRRAADGSPVTHGTRAVFGRKVPVVALAQVSTDGTRWDTTRQVNVLLHETFGPGAAEAAGFTEPKMKRVHARRGTGWGGKRPKGRCADCGRPCTNHRCEDCWTKIRGFGFAGSDDAGLYCGCSEPGGGDHEARV